EVDELGEAGQRDLVPLAPAVLTTADELERGIGALHDHGERARLLHVVVRIHVADLPAAVHLVAECPVAHAIGLGVSVLAAQIRPRGVADAVAVLDPRLGLVHRAGAHVDADERLGAEHAAMLDELTEDPSVHRAEAAPEVDRDAGHARSLQYSPPCWSGPSVPTTPRRSARCASARSASIPRPSAGHRKRSIRWTCGPSASASTLIPISASRSAPSRARL